jgi:hypothetical protein
MTATRFYHAVSNRFPLSKVSTCIWGDGFISKIYKKAVYKGIPTSRSATSADAADFGLGLLTEIADNTTSDINENEQDDLGRAFV